jgi:anti-anti-sigma regulatory factor
VLKITVQKTPKSIAMKLEGAIAGDWVPELEKLWQSLQTSLDGKELSIDLCGVTYVDQKGRKVLAEIYGETGATFLADRPLTQYFADEATKRNSTNKNGGTRK